MKMGPEFQKSIELYQKAQENKEIADRVRQASCIYKGVEKVSALLQSSTKTNKRTLATFLGMVGVAGISYLANNPEISEALNVVLVGLGGALSGDYWGPSSNYSKKAEEEAVFAKLSDGVTAPAHLAVLFAKDDLVSPQRFNKALKSGTEKFQDPRLETARIIFEEKIKTTRKKEERQRRRMEVVGTMMEAQNLGQQMRKSKGFMAKECLRKVGDWTFGAVGIASLAYGVNTALESSSAGGFSSVADDLVYLGPMTLSSPFRKLVRKLSLRKMEQKGASLVRQSIVNTYGRIKMEPQVGVVHFNHQTNRRI